MVRRIRLATPVDSDAVHGIYAPYVRDTMISLETIPPSPDEYRRRMESILAFHPFLVYEEEETIRGFAYASPQMDRPGYRYNVYLSVYMAPDAVGKGLGGALYRRLVPLLKEQGFCNAYALITLPNPGSVALCERHGFRTIGTLRRTGYKFGRWCDVLYMEKDLGAPDNPPTLRPIHALPPDKIAPTLYPPDERG